MLLYSLPFKLIPTRNVDYAVGTTCFSVRCFSVKSSSGGSSPSQHHQSAARDLTSATEPASVSSTSPTQTTYLTSSMQQRSKRPRNFLELKNFKDNYNTLDSTL